MSGGRFTGHDPHRGTDTGGVPWSGRTLQPTGFEGDTGQADPELVAALQRVLSGTGSDIAAEQALVAAVARARLLVPVVAVAGETEEIEGLTADASSDMAAVTLTAPDGTRALPVFSSQAALQEWDDHARPVPVTAARAAQAAVQEGCQVIVIDPPSPGTRERARATYALRGSMVWALAMARDWVPAHHDEQVRAAVASAAAADPRIVGHSCAAGEHGALQITVALPPGGSAELVQDVVIALAQRLATDGEVRARIDALSFAVESGS